MSERESRGFYKCFEIFLAIISAMTAIQSSSAQAAEAENPKDITSISIEFGDTESVRVQYILRESAPKVLKFDVLCGGKLAGSGELHDRKPILQIASNGMAELAGTLDAPAKAADDDVRRFTIRVRSRSLNLSMTLEGSYETVRSHLAASPTMKGLLNDLPQTNVPRMYRLDIINMDGVRYHGEQVLPASRKRS